MLGLLPYTLLYGHEDNDVLAFAKFSGQGVVER